MEVELHHLLVRVARFNPPSHIDLAPSLKQITMPLSITSFVSASKMVRTTAFLGSGNALCSLVIRFTASNALLPDTRITETPHFTIWPNRHRNHAHVPEHSA